MPRKSEPIDDIANNRQFDFTQALQKHDFVRAKALLEAGASFDLRYRFGPRESAMPIMCSLAQDGNVKALEFAIANGASAGNPAGDIDSPLSLAAKFGHTNVMDLLLHHGASIESPGHSWGGALHAACYANQVEAAKVCVRNGADVEAATGLDDWPLKICCNRVTPDGAEILDYILSLKPDLYRCDTKQQTAAEHVVRYGRPAVYLAALLDAGYDSAQPQKSGFTLRELAVQNNNLEAVALIDAHVARKAMTAVIDSLPRKHAHNG